MAGEEFWDFINLDYAEIINKCESLFKKIEPEVLEFFNNSV